MATGFREQSEPQWSAWREAPGRSEPREGSGMTFQVLGEAQAGLNPESLGEEPLTEQVSLAPTQPEEVPSLGAITYVTRQFFSPKASDTEDSLPWQSDPQKPTLQTPGIAKTGTRTRTGDLPRG